MSGVKAPSWISSASDITGTVAEEGPFTPGVYTHTHNRTRTHTHRQGYQSGLLRVNDMSHSVSQCLTVCHSVSPEMEAVLLSGWAEPVAAGSGGGVDKPQCEEGLHVTSSAWTQTCVSRGRKESKKKGRKELGKEGRKERKNGGK